jgi:hypothetical protein
LSILYPNSWPWFNLELKVRVTSGLIKLLVNTTAYFRINSCRGDNSGRHF